MHSIIIIIHDMIIVNFQKISNSLSFGTCEPKMKTNIHFMTVNLNARYEYSFDLNVVRSLT